MRLDLYPLENETDEGVLVRLEEECAEVIIAACKIKRFGMGNYHPDRPASNNLAELISEIADVKLCIKEINRRREAKSEYNRREI